MTRLVRPQEKPQIREFRIEGSCSAHELLREKPGKLTSIVEASRRASGAGSTVRWELCVSPHNVFGLTGVSLLAAEEGVDLLLTYSQTTLAKPNTTEPRGLNSIEKAFLYDFLESDALANTNLSPERRLFYRALLARLGTKAQAGSVSAGDRSDVAPNDPHIWTRRMDWRERLRNSKAGRLSSAGLQALEVFSDGLLGALRIAYLDVWTKQGTPRVPAAGVQYKTALLIGAYGGEHVGDAAILGGVLLRLYEKYGTRRVLLASFRPSYTERWVRAIECTVEVCVIPYERRDTERLLHKADCLVFAGGPLMDLPMLLVKHLNLVAAAREQGKPFWLERVGVGPFKRRLSCWVARQIVKAADQISVRTSFAGHASELAGCPVEVGRDPAFDYLDTRRRLTRLSAQEEEAVQALLTNDPGGMRIGINLRPIRHLWDENGQAHSRVIENRFIERFAAALQEVHWRSSVPLRFIFFPMNPMQFGLSDLHTAYRLHQLVGSKIDLRVWEYDPSIDGLLYLLRRLDGAVAMRLHACIFALSQSVPVLGIDYSVGKRGKVGEMFWDLGRAADCSRIDEFETSWLVERLLRMARRTPAMEKN